MMIKFPPRVLKYYVLILVVGILVTGIIVFEPNSRLENCWETKQPDLFRSSIGSFTNNRGIPYECGYLDDNLKEAFCRPMISVPCAKFKNFVNHSNQESIFSFLDPKFS